MRSLNKRFTQRALIFTLAIVNVSLAMLFWNVGVVYTAAPTPSRTPTATTKPTKVMTPTATITATARVTPTQTITVTMPTATMTPTKTITLAATITPTAVVSPTRTITLTPTATPTRVITPTSTATITPTKMITPTATLTPAATPTPLLPPPAPSAPLTGALLASKLTVPAGMLWIPGNLGGHFWISDNVLGFCRLDSAVGTTTAALNATTCVGSNRSAVGQAAFDPVNKFVYVPDSSAASQGVYRLAFNPATETVGKPTVLASGQNLGANRPVAAALGPDGNVYVSFKQSGSIVRITTPSTATQTIEPVGVSMDARRVMSLAFVGNDLYLAESSKVTRITNAAAPNCTGNCNATPLNAVVILPSALLYDGSTYLYIGNIARVVRYNIATGAQHVYADTFTLNGNMLAFQGVSALGLDPNRNLYVGDDPGLGFTTGDGHIWKVAPSK